MYTTDALSDELTLVSQLLHILHYIMIVFSLINYTAVLHVVFNWSLL